jgi:hypothetical protein
MLFLDDSGKPDAGHPSLAVVIAGFSIDTEVFPRFARCVQGAKKAFFPKRGFPHTWEVKSTDIIKPNPWKRKANRSFCAEVARLILVHGGTCYSATIIKANMHHPMTLATSTPLQLQALVEHFAVECRALNRVGMTVADWSTHQHDQHVSSCVASFVNSNRLNVHPCVYYASSHASEGVQVADLVAGVRRRTAEGDHSLQTLAGELAGIRRCSPTAKTVKGRSYANCFQMF